MSIEPMMVMAVMNMLKPQPQAATPLAPQAPTPMPSQGVDPEALLRVQQLLAPQQAPQINSLGSLIMGQQPGGF